MKRQVKRAIKSALRWTTQPHVTVSSLHSQLESLGVRNGSCLLVHASLSKLGYVRGGPATVIRAILEALGENGTLVMPSHTWKLTNAGSREFDIRNTPSLVGRVSEVFRQRDDVVRSLHPSHSVCALGPLAEWIVEGHENAGSPCGAGTPYAKIMDVGGQILLLGVTLRRNTMFHAIETMADVPYLLKPHDDEFTVTDRHGVRRRLRFRCHAKAVPSRFDEMEPLLEKWGVLRRGKTGATESRLIEAARLRNQLLPLLKRIPRFLLMDCDVGVDQPSCTVSQATNA